jgi:Subtilase family
MNVPCKRTLAAVFIFWGMVVAGADASNLDTIGVTLLRTMTTNVNGTGIRVAQPEASLSTNSPIWEVNPADDSVEQPVSLFTYTSTNGSATDFPNSLGFGSSHADEVAGNFYGLPSGVATNVAHVDNYDADYFYNSIVAAALPANINDSIVNQSFTFGSVDTNTQKTIDSNYDNYAVQFNTLFISAANNGGPVSPPGTSYNCISVGAYLDGTNYSSVGPTLDNGRAKPDITAPGQATSFTTPLVAGAAALLVQAGLRGDGGSDTNAAADMRTVKALLLNGAVKPADWTNIPPSPLDTNYGAGVLNVFNSYEQLAGGKHDYTASESIASGNPHPPTGASGNIGALSGWDFNTISSSSSFLSSSDGVNEYYFNVTNGANNADFTAAITLVWNRPQSRTPGSHSGINNLDLFLYNAATSNLVACSTSLVDNVEHIWLPRLPQGRYDLQVLKNAANSVNNNETYALAWEFFSASLSLTPSGTNVAVSWPVYPAGFVLESATDLASPVWNTNEATPIITNGQNVVWLNATNGAQFFRLQRP